MELAIQTVNELLDAAVEAGERYTSKQHNAGRTESLEGAQRNRHRALSRRSLSGEDVSALRAKYQAAADRLQSLDQAAEWLGNQTSLVLDGTKSDSSAQLNDLKHVVESAWRPGPSRMLIEAELEEAAHELGPAFQDALIAYGRAYLSASGLVEEFARRGSDGQHPAVAAIQIRVLVGLIHLNMEPTELVLRQFHETISQVAEVARDSLVTQVAERLGKDQGRLLDRSGLAERIGVAERTVTAMANRGELPPGYLIGGVRRWDWAEVRRYLENRRQRKPRKRRGTYDRTRNRSGA